MTRLDTWIEHWARHRPRTTALVFEGEIITYGALAQKVRATAAGLAGHRVAGGDRVAFCGLNRPEQLHLLFACARLGAVLVPLNNRLAVGEHRAQIADSEPRVILATDGFADRMAEAAGAVPVRDLDRDPFPAEASERPASAPQGTPASPVLMVYTSGTTGTPKGAVLSQSALLFTVLNGVALQDLHRRDRILTLLPLFHVGGLNIQTLPALYAGASVVLQRRFEPGEFLDLVDAHQPTQTLMVPATMRAVIDHPRFGTTDLSCLRGLNSGSSVVPEAVIRPFLERGVPVGQVYGSTETGPTAIVLDYAHGADHLGSCGKPALHTDVRIVTSEGADAGPGDSGELWLRGPNLFHEYWRRPDATSEAFVDDWYRSGDVGHRDPDGYIHISDRLRDMVISGGENVYPAEVEAVLAAHPDIAEVAVIGRPDPRWGEAVVAVAVLRPGASLEVDALRSWCEPRLGRYKQPRDLVVTESLPRTALGKVQKHLLRAALPGG